MDLAPSDLKFGWVEYTVVAAMLLLSTVIGIYYTCFNKQDTFSEYMLGGKNMGVFPVFMSIVASFVSGVTLLGVPTEIYLYGTQFSASNFANVFIMVLTGILFLPVYHRLQLNSLFEYLELRFNHVIRVLGTFIFSLSMVLYLPAVIYVPAIAFNQVTDIPLYIITPIICAACLFYTAFGGLKAVLWTDALQNIFTFFALIFVAIIGCVRLGGFGEIWKINKEGGRLELFNMDPDPTARYTFWTVFINIVFIFLVNISTNPGSVQRFMAVPSLRKARIVLAFSSIGFFIVVNLSIFLGMVLYARYYKCDPIASGLIKKANQMVPFYVMEVTKDFPGLAGLFMAGVLSAALSTMSSLLNTVGGTLYKDIMEVFFPTLEHSELQQSTAIKVIVLVLGIICGALVTVVDKLGTIFQVAVSVLGILNGSVLSLFILGMFIPRANVKGAFVGSVVSILFTSWIAAHGQYYLMTGKIKYYGKKTSIDHCPLSVVEHFNSSYSLLYNYTGIGSPVEVDDSVPLLYRISYNYYIVLGAFSGILVGVIVSVLSKAPDLTALNPDLFSPCVHRFLPRRTSSARPHREEYILKSVNRTGKKIVITAKRENKNSLDT